MLFMKVSVDLKDCFSANGSLCCTYKSGSLGLWVSCYFFTVTQFISVLLLSADRGDTWISVKFLKYLLLVQSWQCKVLTEVFRSVLPVFLWEQEELSGLLGVCRVVQRSVLEQTGEEDSRKQLLDSFHLPWNCSTVFAMWEACRQVMHSSFRWVFSKFLHEYWMDFLLVQSLPLKWWIYLFTGPAFVAVLEEWPQKGCEEACNPRFKAFGQQDATYVE